ncbi:Mg/Co/Ni transporter MgtE / CBS domain [Actinomycetales bacterium JB111]|nr:Mg/Co/Ni transporter MgtE / CBS domain [Actinomycetales bacterium JB111]
MTAPRVPDVFDLIDRIDPLIDARDFPAIVEAISPASVDEVASLLKRLTVTEGAVVFRLLTKDRAVRVFEQLSAGVQSDLVHALKDAEVAEIFADLDPDDRVELLDELPATLAPRLLRGLSDKERRLTAAVLGYPKGSVGRRMTPEYISAREDSTAGEALERVRLRIDDAEAIYTLPVLDDSRHVVGVIGLKDLMRARPEDRVADLMRRPTVATAYADAEEAARTCASAGYLAIPIVDNESRLVGMLTIDDAMRVLQHEESEDAARQGGVEPLRRPYLATSIRSLASTRIVWLLVLAVGATLTVQVLEVFEATLEEVTVLALFVPLLIGTGGNTGNQAATTITRALALGDVRPRDVWRVLARELGVGLSLGTLLGLLGGTITSLVYEPRIGLVIGLTLLAVCAMAAAIGGVMPMIARALRVDPAVFSNPFISTFVDATGLIVYFVIARAVLGI